MSMMENTFDDADPVPAPITLCRTGQRSKTIVERVRGGTVPVTTATALSPKEVRTIVRGASHERFETSAKIARQEQETLSVGVDQPHRRGAEDPRDPRLAFPLGRFCARAWPNDRKTRDAMTAAGESYAADVRAALQKRGFHTDDCHADESASISTPDEMTPEEIADLRAEIYALERTVARADEELRDVMRRCPAAMVRLCVDLSEPLANDEDMLKHGLYKLALHYSHIERARHLA